MYRIKLRYLSTLVVLLCALYYVIKTNPGALAENTKVDSFVSTEDIVENKKVNKAELKKDKGVENYTLEPILITDIYYGLYSIEVERTIIEKSCLYEINQIPFQDYDNLKFLASLSFTALEAEPYVRIANPEVSIGIGSKGFLIPANVYELLPKEIISIGMYEENGRIILQRKANMLPPWMSLDLGDIGLTREDEYRFKYSESKVASLELVQNYQLILPKLTHPSVEVEDLSSVIIEIPFKFHYLVND